MSSRSWDRASALPVPFDGARRAEVVALKTGLPSVPELFTFMRDAELRFSTLRMRIDERVVGGRGEQRFLIEALVQHPGLARVTSTEPGHGVAGNYELWISDGEVVRTYSAIHRLATRRPARRAPVGLDSSDLPGASRVYTPRTALPMETLPEMFVHPAGFCQNVLATGECWIAGIDRVAGREAVLVECDHPRTTEVSADRPDHHFQLATDRETGIVLRLIETTGGQVTRHAEVTSLDVDPVLPPSTFEFEFPAGATTIF